MNAQERESVRVSLSVADNAYRKGAAQGKKRGGRPHRLSNGNRQRADERNARTVIIIAAAGNFSRRKDYFL